jgi:hypothetical protein
MGKLMILMAPSMIVGLLLIVAIFLLIRALGGKFAAVLGALGARFLDAQDRQAAAFEKIAKGVEVIQSGMGEGQRNYDGIRITLTAIASKVSAIESKIDRILESSPPNRITASDHREPGGGGVIRP